MPYYPTSPLADIINSYCSYSCFAAHTSIDHLLTSATHSKHQAALLDSFIAGHFQEKFIKFRLVEIIEHVFSYGIVLSDKGLWLEPNIRNYMQNNKEKLFKIMSMTIRPLKVRMLLSYNMCSCC